MTAPRAYHDELWGKWQKWFDRALNDVRILHLDRTLYRKLRDAVVESGPQDTGTWLLHYGRCYLEKQTIAVRRVMDKRDTAEAFGRLLSAMELSPQVFTVDRVLVDVRDDEWIRNDVRTTFAMVQLANGTHVDPEWVREVHEQLDREVEAVVAYANRMVAHADQRGQALPLTWGELNTVIDDLGVRMQEFGITFRAAHYEMEPFITDDWKNTFRRPLFKPYPVRWPWGYPDF